MPGNEHPQLSLFDQEEGDLVRLDKLEWPTQELFPLNLSASRNVGERVNADLVKSETPLIVTGFAGLDHVIDLIDEILTCSPRLVRDRFRVCG